MPRGNPATSQTVRATLGLRALLFEGAFSRGERVPEVGLAARLGVSRTPMRLALSTLAHEGLLEPLTGGGFVVRSFTREDIVDAIELRGVLEGTAARLAAERLSASEELVPLERLVTDLEEVVGDLSPASLPVYVELNTALHDALVRLAKSPTVTRAIVNVNALPFASPGALLPAHALLPRSREILVVAQHQHRALLDAIRAGHGSRAEGVAREHARLAQLNLDLALEDGDVLDHLDGGRMVRPVVSSKEDT